MVMDHRKSRDRGKTLFSAHKFLRQTNVCMWILDQGTGLMGDPFLKAINMNNTFISVFILTSEFHYITIYIVITNLHVYLYFDMLFPFWKFKAFWHRIYKWCIKMYSIRSRHRQSMLYYVSFTSINTCCNSLNFG